MMTPDPDVAPAPKHEATVVEMPINPLEHNWNRAQRPCVSQKTVRVMARLAGMLAVIALLVMLALYTRDWIFGMEDAEQQVMDICTRPSFIPEEHSIGEWWAPLPD